MGNKTTLDQWQEYRAKFTIEKLFPEYGPLEKLDRPDLQGNGIGIEIVTAYSEVYNRAENSYTNYRLAQVRRDAAIATHDEAICILAERSMEASAKYVEYRDSKYVKDKCSGEVSSRALYEEGARFLDVSGNKIRVGFYRGDYFTSQLPLVLDAVGKKCEKLNNAHSGYHSFPCFGLFVESALLIHDCEELNKVCCNVHEIICKYPRKFDFVFLAGYRIPHYIVHYNLHTSKAEYKEFQESLYYNELSQLSHINDIKEEQPNDNQ